MVIVLEKELAALSMRPGDDVKPVLDKIKDTYARMAAARSNVPQMQQCTKIISVLDNSWDNLIPTLNTQQDHWTPEWLRQQILQEDFRRRHTGGGAANKTAEGYGAAGGSRGRGGGRGQGRGRGFGRGRGRGDYNEGHGNSGGKGSTRMEGACWYCKKAGHSCLEVFVLAVLEVLLVLELLDVLLVLGLQGVLLVLELLEVLLVLELLEVLLVLDLLEVLLVLELLEVLLVLELLEVLLVLELQEVLLVLVMLEVLLVLELLEVLLVLELLEVVLVLSLLFLEALRGRGRTTFRSFSSRALHCLVLLLTLDRLEVLRSVVSLSRVLCRLCLMLRRQLRPPPVPGTHSMTLRPSTAPQRVPLPTPSASSVSDDPDSEPDSLRAAGPTVMRFLATAVTDPLFESSAVSALVA
ncbi:unnamed protein product [Closterium sp. NIES-54]